jgi:sugar lactone lactonase YvrE
MDRLDGVMRSTRSRLLGKATVALLLTALVVAPMSALAGSRPKIIPLPRGWQPEGIATNYEGSTFYSGSLATGAIFRGNLRTGAGKVFIPGGSGRVAVGLKVKRGMLFVAGGPTGQAYVFDVHSGREIATLQLTTGNTFINDVAITRRAAWFTDSFKQQLYKVPIREGDRVGKPQTLPLTGDIAFVPGQFNANGIDATLKWLVIVQSNTGELFRVNPRTGKAEVIDLRGQSVVSGDGILLDDYHRLWVVQNALPGITLIRLSCGFESGRVLSRRFDKSFDVPTTVAESDGYLAVINARFGISNPDMARYWITQIRKPHPNSDR